MGLVESLSQSNIGVDRIRERVERVGHDNEIDPLFLNKILSVLEHLWAQPSSKSKQNYSLTSLPLLCCRAYGGGADEVEGASVAWSLLYSAMILECGALIYLAFEAQKHKQLAESSIKGLAVQKSAADELRAMLKHAASQAGIWT